jgi:hypothetical protein
MRDGRRKGAWGALALVVGLTWVGGCVHYDPPSAFTDEDFAWHTQAWRDDVATLTARLVRMGVAYGDRQAGVFRTFFIGTPQVVPEPGGGAVAYMLADAVYPNTGKYLLGKLVFTPAPAGTTVRIGARRDRHSRETLERRTRAYVAMLEGRPPWEP